MNEAWWFDRCWKDTLKGARTCNKVVASEAVGLCAEHLEELRNDYPYEEEIQVAEELPLQGV